MKGEHEVVSRVAGAQGSGSPTRPSAGTRRARRPISSPRSDCAAGPIAAQTSRLTASKEARTTSSTSGVVTRRPRTKTGSMPRRVISSVICGPAPCTTTAGPPIRASASRTASAATRPPSLSTTRPLTSCTPR